jgi:hypothetical protein
MKLYKLTDQNMQTYNGYQWELGVKRTATGSGTHPCSNGVLHAYTDPRLAVIFNRIHANIANPKLFIIETDDYIGSDGKKCWSKSQTLISNIPLPIITSEQLCEFAIRCAILVYKNPTYILWANQWLSGINRSADAADAAHAAATAHAAHAAAYASAHADAAHASAYAVVAATADAAHAAAYAVDAATADAAHAAYAAAAAVHAAADAASIDLIQILDFMGIPK